MKQANAPAPSQSLVRAIRRALRPFVRLMLASGITYPFVSELLKGLFIEIADRNFRLDGRPMSDSRMHLITGVHRKDVRRLRASDLPIEEMVPAAVSLGGRLVGDWLSDKRFLDAEGNPRPLPLTPKDDGSVGFEDLVANRSTDIGPRVVLDEWLRLGIIRVDQNDCCVLNTDAFVPKDGLDEKLFFFAHNLHDHAAAATDNLLGERAPQLERSLIYEGLTAEGIDALDKRARRLGTKVLQDLNRVATERDERDAGSAAPRHRFTCGVYFYSEPVDRQDPEAQARP